MDCLEIYRQLLGKPPKKKELQNFDILAILTSLPLPPCFFVLILTFALFVMSTLFDRFGHIHWKFWNWVGTILVQILIFFCRASLRGPSSWLKCPTGWEDSVWRKQTNDSNLWWSFQTTSQHCATLWYIVVHFHTFAGIHLNLCEFVWHLLISFQCVELARGLDRVTDNSPKFVLSCHAGVLQVCCTALW